jgi:HSP20 family protein
MIPTRRNGHTLLQSWNQLVPLRREMTGLLEQLDAATRGGTGMTWAPAASVREDADSISIELELPGVDPGAVDIALEDRVLTIAGEKGFERRDEQENWHVHERRFGRFERRFTLGRSVDPDQIEASYERGVLTVRLPKPEEARPRRIRISSRDAAAGVESGRDVGPAQP